MNILSNAAIGLICFPHHILARGYTTTLADLDSILAYDERVRDAIACYQKNRLNPFTYDIRRIKNGGIL